jgi:hypothetical protein
MKAFNIVETGIRVNQCSSAINLPLVAARLLCVIRG